MAQLRAGKSILLGASRAEARMGGSACVGCGTAKDDLEHFLKCPAYEGATEEVFGKKGPVPLTRRR